MAFYFQTKAAYLHCWSVCAQSISKHQKLADEVTASALRRNFHRMCENLACTARLKSMESAARLSMTRLSLRRNLSLWKSFANKRAKEAQDSYRIAKTVNRRKTKKALRSLFATVEVARKHSARIASFQQCQAARKLSALVAEWRRYCYFKSKRRHIVEVSFRSVWPCTYIYMCVCV